MLSISPDQRNSVVDRAVTEGGVTQPDQRWRSWLPRAVFVGGMVVTVALFVGGAWQRRWIADDGLIVLRTVRNLMAGNGPVFNVGERVETNTSAVWTYLIWFFGWLTGVRLEYVSLVAALTLSVLAIVFAMLGAARLWTGPSRTARRAQVLLLPAGVIAYIAVPPARDYATSGLENGLVICYLALLWWLLMRWSTAQRPRLATVFGIAVVAGLSWLVRPELTLVGALTGLLIMLAPVPASGLGPRGLRVLLVIAAGALPLGYEFFRMGYYGLPVPNTAIAKEAGGAKWGQGLAYLWDLTGPYLLWLPVAVLAVAGVLAWRARRPSRESDSSDNEPTAGSRPRWDVAWLLKWVVQAWRHRERLRSPASVVTITLLGGLLLVAYELRVGGDFMHGRMLLPQLFCLLLPVAVVPVGVPQRNHAGPSERRLWVGWRAPAPWAGMLVALWVATLVWSVAVSGSAGNKSGTHIGTNGIVDERVYYVLNSGQAHPVLAEDYLFYPRMRAMVKDIEDSPDGGLLLSSPSYRIWFVAPPPLPIPPGGFGHTVFFLNLGMTSMNVPLSVRVIDQEGLAYPLAAHTDRLVDGRIGHDKNLFPDWVVVDSGMVDRHPWMPFYLDERWVDQARAALACPDTQALLASARAPLTLGRFRHNLEQAFHFAGYRIDRVPKYEIQRCHLVDPTLGRATN